MGTDDRADLRDELGFAAKDLAAFLPELLRGLGVLDVLDDPRVVARLHALAGVAAKALERARPCANALDRSDLLLERENRLDLQRRADPGPGAADAPAPAQVLERVDGKPHLQRAAALVAPRSALLGAAARCRHSRGANRAHAHPAAARAGIDDD